MQGRCLKAKAELQRHLRWEFCRVPVHKFVFAVIREQRPPQSRGCCSSEDLAVKNTCYCPQAHAPVVWKREILADTTAAFAKGGCCSVLVTSLMLPVLLQVNVTTWLCFTSLGIFCAGNCNATATFLLLHNSSRKNSRLKGKLPCHCPKILYHLW